MNAENLYFDNTMISSYRECGRKFFFRHYRDWTFDGQTPIELVFGLAWHEALAAFWGGDSVAGSHGRFVKTWIENGYPEPTAANYQKIVERDERRTPWVALEMLNNYAKARGKFISECTSIEIERPFAVPLDIEWHGRKVFYIGRLDKSVEHKFEGRLIIEHKTTGWYAKEGGFRSDYIESFSPNSQVDGYIFAGNSLYPTGVAGVWVDAALVHKTVHDKFRFIPCQRHFAMLDDWLDDTRMWVNRILADRDAIEQHQPAFPKNTSNCMMYMRACAYKDLCRFQAKPKDISTPVGYKVEPWHPFELLRMEEPT